VARTLLITGASSGIGAATARAAVAAGWDVALAARRVEPLEALCAELGAERSIAVATDVTDFDAVEQLVAAAVDRFGAVDAVFANAGFGARRGFTEETVEHWRSMVLTNVLGTALTIRAALPQILERRGHFVLTGSVAGTRALPGSLYSSTKFAVHGMAESLRLELDGSGARVTLIAPGMVDTPFFDAGAPDWALHDGDVASAVLFALEQPERVDLNMLLLRPTAQAN
jgi:NADP-dependent 3-hydroxy acid dehydrogenase YdfG